MLKCKKGEIKGGSYLCLLIVNALLCGGCGGEFPPRELWRAAVEVHEINIQKELIYDNSNIGLILGMFQVETNEIAIIGWGGSCLLSLPENLATCKRSLAELGVIPPISQSGSFLSGGYIQADFNGDGNIGRLKPVTAGFKLENTSGSEVTRTKLDRNYWFEPSVTWSQPHHILVSTDGMLLVLDNHLQKIRSLSTTGIRAPLHISAGSRLDCVGRGPFVSVFVGRGGWHRSILFIHSTDERVIYKEILLGDFKAVWPLPKKNGKFRFLLGGRGQVWEYSFRMSSCY